MKHNPSDDHGKSCSADMLPLPCTGRAAARRDLGRLPARLTLSQKQGLHPGKAPAPPEAGDQDAIPGWSCLVDDSLRGVRLADGVDGHGADEGEEVGVDVAQDGVVGGSLGQRDVLKDLRQELFLGRDRRSTYLVLQLGETGVALPGEVGELCLLVVVDNLGGVSAVAVLRGSTSARDVGTLRLTSISYLNW